VTGVSVWKISFLKWICDVSEEAEKRACGREFIDSEKRVFDLWDNDFN
jgi:hypothetical protein